MFTLLAKAEYPTAPLDLQFHLGWLALLFVMLAITWVWTRSEALRRAFFAREDPRLFALFRIGLGLITIQNFWNLNMHWRMLWTDEGMFTADEVRKRVGRTALTGWNELDGFIDHWAVLKFFWGKYSLLFIESSPTFVQLYLAALFVALVLYTLGFRSRVTAVIAMLLINSLYNRNAVFLEGHDTVFRCMWFMAIFARVDEAWSIDNWLRRKREQRLAARLRADPAVVPFDWLHLLDRAGHWLWGGLWAWLFCVVVEFEPGTVYEVVLTGIVVCVVVGLMERENRRGLAARGRLEPREPVRFRLIPAWPRYLFIAQLICLYSATGLYKTGSVWKRGDALYYALNMDHFYRFEVLTQWVSVFLATNVFRVMTLITLYWEKLFVLVAIGLILRFRHVHRDAPWMRELEASTWRKWLGRAALVGAYAVLYRAVVLAYPWCLVLRDDGSPTPAQPGLSYLHIWMAGVIPAFVVVWFVLGRWPLPIGKLLGLALRGRTPQGWVDATIDQESLRKWLFGRRVWLTIGVLFHGMLLLTMNIGMFPVIMIWFYPLFFEAKPVLIAGRWLAEKLRARRSTAWLAPRLLDSALSEDEDVLETAAASLRRDPTGPWWQDPWKLIAGGATLMRGRRALSATIERSHTRGGRIPDAVVYAVIVVGAALVVLRGLEAKIEEDEPKALRVTPEQREQRHAEIEARKDRIDQLGDAGHWWVYAGLGFAAVSHFRRRPAMDQLPDEDAETKSETESGAAAYPVEPQLIGGTLMRTVALGFFVFHCAAIGVSFIPHYSVTELWRTETHKPFGRYVSGINLSQSWKMFAPNPPRSNTFMRTVVIDQDGSPYQVGKDHYTERPYVFWYNDRERKMHRRMIGKSKWYLRYWAQYHCRDWALNNDGQLPAEIRMFRLKTPIPKPEELAQSRVASDPRQRPLRTEIVETHDCDPDVITPEMKRRRGWPLTEDDHAALEREEKDRIAEAKATRRQWGARQDFGGKPRKAQLQLPAASGGGDGGDE